MHLSVAGIVLLLASATVARSSEQAQNVFATEVRDYSLEANGLVEALAKISAQFHFPLGVEWVQSATTLAPICFQRSRATLKEIIQAVVSANDGYEWRVEDGVCHVFQRDLVKDRRNPLNVIIKSLALAETVGMMDNILFQIVRQEVRVLPGARGIAGSVLGYPNEPLVGFVVENGPARKIVNQIITSDTRTEPPSAVKMRRIWIATFPEKPVFSSKGFLEVVPTGNSNPQAQPFWILLRWGDPVPTSILR